MWRIGGKKKRKSRKKSSLAKGFLVGSFVTLWPFLRAPAIASLLGLLIFFTWLKYSGDYNRIAGQFTQLLNHAQESSDLVLENILLDGHKYTPKEQIISSIKNKGSGPIYIGHPMLSIDLWAIKDNLEKLTWVKHAAVSRQFPSTLNISVTERQPMALWQNNGKVQLIDNDGEVIGENNFTNFTNLLILVGSNIPFHAGDFLRFTANPPAIANMISSGTLVNGRRWNVKLKNGILVKLPENDPEEAWEYLVKEQQENKILESNIATIDLRIEKKMYVRTY